MDAAQTKEENNGPKIYGEVCVRKQRRKRRKLLLIELLYEYAKNSTLHGLRYIVERTLHAFEKIFWLLTFIMSVGMCFYLISNVWIKWKTSPVIVSFSEKVVPVGDVPFPSITICPQLKCKATVFNYSDAYREYNALYKSGKLNFENGQWDKLHDIDMLCGSDAISTPRNFTDSSTIKNFFEVAPTANEVFVQCLWRAGKFPCHLFFESVLTNQGICYTFNGLAADEILRNENLQQDYKYLTTSIPSQDWSMTEGYTDFRPKKTYPKRGRENYAFPDLTVLLNESPEHRDVLCNGMRSGFTIYVQHPADLPQSSLYYYAALPNQISSLALKFNKVSTDESLKAYSPDIRQCYFPGDKYLRYFRIYTKNNCRLECQSNYTFTRCGCVWFHMPHGRDSRRICISDKSKGCVHKALDVLTAVELNAKNKTIHINSCKCLPACDSVTYDAEILKTNFNIMTYLQTRQELIKEDGSYLKSYNLSAIEVYFKEPGFISMRRSELFGVTDFLANCGGLLGLFLGFSFLSLVEIFYFATIRLFTILRRDLREEKKANKEKQDLNEDQKY